MLQRAFDFVKYTITISYSIIYIYLFHTQSKHIDKSYMNSNKTIHKLIK